MALESPARDRIVFTGRYSRDQVAILNAISRIYAFPSVAMNDPDDFAGKIVQILSDKTLHKRFSQHSIKLASGLSERHQTEKILELYREALRK